MNESEQATIYGEVNLPKVERYYFTCKGPLQWIFAFSIHWKKFPTYYQKRKRFSKVVKISRQWRNWE